MSDSFHLVLASNASMDMYPTNKATQFTNHMPIPIELDASDWVVGLKDIAYPNQDEVDVRSWQFMIIYERTVNAKVPGSEEHFEILEFFVNQRESHKVQTVNDVVAFIQNKINESFEEAFETPEIKGDFFERVIDGETVVMDFLGSRNLHKYRKFKEHFRISLRHESRSNTIIFDYKPSIYIASVKIIFNNYTDIFKILGFDVERKSQSTLPFASIRPATIYYHQSMMFVYCDIVEQMICGDFMTQLIATLPLPNEKGEKMQHERFEKPMYRKLNKKYISSISLWLAYESGEHMKFPVGKTIATLEFRKA